MSSAQIQNAALRGLTFSHSGVRGILLLLSESGNHSMWWSRREGRFHRIAFSWDRLGVSGDKMSTPHDGR